MKNSHLSPALHTNFINGETGELAVRYRPGHPRQYRFDASRGHFSVNGESPITKRGESLSFIPISFRIFKDDILGFGLKKWIEFFFINEGGHLCNLLFHGYSVENLERRTSELFYDQVNLTEVQLTATPIEKVVQSGDAKGSKYFIADFSYKVLNKEDREFTNLMGESLEIWRADTLTGDAMMELSVNYLPPFQLINGVGEIDTGQGSADTLPERQVTEVSESISQ